MLQPDSSVREARTFKTGIPLSRPPYVQATARSCGWIRGLGSTRRCFLGRAEGEEIGGFAVHTTRTVSSPSRLMHRSTAWACAGTPSRTFLSERCRLMACAYLQYSKLAYSCEFRTCLRAHVIIQGMSSEGMRDGRLVPGRIPRARCTRSPQPSLSVLYCGEVSVLYHLEHFALPRAVPTQRAWGDAGSARCSRRT